MENSILEDQRFFSPIQTERISQKIEEQIKEAIIKRHYRAGDKLPPERELAEMFHTSRTSIREALRSLEKSGFIMIKKGVHGGGFVIKGDSKCFEFHDEFIGHHTRVSWVKQSPTGSFRRTTFP